MPFTAYFGIGQVTSSKWNTSGKETAVIIVNQRGFSFADSNEERLIQFSVAFSGTVKPKCPSFRIH